jgi:hypothetical protein
MTITRFSVHSSGVQTEQWPFPFALIALFISPFYERDDEEEGKNPVYPRGATVPIVLFIAQSCAHPLSSELATIIFNKLSPAPKKGPSPKRDILLLICPPNLATLLSHNNLFPLIPYIIQYASMRANKYSNWMMHLLHA